MSIRIDSGSLETTLKGMENVKAKLFDALLVVSKSASKQMEAYAKQNAKWTDRTGNARQLLTGDADWLDSKTLEIALAHQVDYGVWLELAHQKKYAILDEAIKAKTPELMNAYKKLVGDIK